MVVRNLFFNTLDILLSSITSRSHWLTLHLTRRTFEFISVDGWDTEVAVAKHVVVDLFRQVTVNTLFLEAFEEDRHWLSAVDIWEILHAMPDIETLRIHNWDYSTENINLSQARIRDEEAFKNMAASYFNSLEHMALAGAVVEGSESPALYDYLEGDEPIVTWFRENVPNFELTSNYKVPPEFCAPVWGLW
ncbi:hypothetical protein RSAG8_13525, partial [Rhizoctonia solani AG-8 WAC10335]